MYICYIYYIYTRYGYIHITYIYIYTYVYIYIYIAYKYIQPSRTDESLEGQNTCLWIYTLWIYS